MVGLPIAGIGTMFYAVLLLGMGATALWRWGLGLTKRIGKRWWPGQESGSRLPVRRRSLTEADLGSARRPSAIKLP